MIKDLGMFASILGSLCGIGWLVWVMATRRTNDRLRVMAQVGRVIEFQAGWLIEGLDPDVLLDKTTQEWAVKDLKRLQAMAQHLIALAEGHGEMAVVPAQLKPQQDKG